jgi:hypothetical protein
MVVRRLIEFTLPMSPEWLRQNGVSRTLDRIRSLNTSRTGARRLRAGNGTTQRVSTVDPAQYRHFVRRCAPEGGGITTNWIPLAPKDVDDCPVALGHDQVHPSGREPMLENKRKPSKDARSRCNGFVRSSHLRLRKLRCRRSAFAALPLRRDIAPKLASKPGERRRMAEREGFEPSVRFPVHTLSKRAPSTTRTSLRICRINSLRASG